MTIEMDTSTMNILAVVIHDHSKDQIVTGIEHQAFYVPYGPTVLTNVDEMDNGAIQLAIEVSGKSSKAYSVAKKIKEKVNRLINDPHISAESFIVDGNDTVCGQPVIVVLTIEETH